MGMKISGFLNLILVAVTLVGVAFSADSQSLITVPKRFREELPGIFVWNMATSEKRSFGVGMKLSWLAMMNDNRRLIGGMFDGKIRVWDIRSEKLMATLPGHRTRVSTIAVSPDDSKLASGSMASEALIWDATKLPKVK